MTTQLPNRRKPNERIYWPWFDRFSDRFDLWLDEIGERWSNLAVLFILLMSAIGVAIISGDAQLTLEGSWWESFWQNFGTELFGAFFTFLLIEGIVGAREKRSDRELQEGIAKEIREQLRTYTQAQEIARLRSAQSIQDRQSIIDSMNVTGLLQGSFISEVDLQKIKFDGADLSQSTLAYCNFRNAWLRSCSLRLADLEMADFEGADLGTPEPRWHWQTGPDERVGSDLRGAHVHHATFRNANLSFANLEGVILITMGQLKGARTLRGVILPDGTHLPSDDSWEEAFNQWTKEAVQRTIKGAYEEGTYVVPSRTSDNANKWDLFFKED